MRRTRRTEAGAAAGSPQRSARTTRQDAAVADSTSTPLPKRGRGRPRNVDQSVATREEASEQLLRLATLASTQLNLAPTRLGQTFPNVQAGDGAAILAEGTASSASEMVFVASSQPFGAENVPVSQVVSQANEEETFVAHGPESQEGFDGHFESEAKESIEGAIIGPTAAEGNEDERNHAAHSKTVPIATSGDAADLNLTPDLNPDVNHMSHNQASETQKVILVSQQSDGERSGEASNEGTAPTGLFKPVIDVTSAHAESVLTSTFPEMYSAPPLLFLPLFNSGPTPTPMYPAQGGVPFRRLLQPVQGQTQSPNQQNSVPLFLPLFSTSSSAASNQVTDNAHTALAKSESDNTASSVGKPKRTLSPLPSASGDSSFIPDHPTAIPPDASAIKERDAEPKQASGPNEAEPDDNVDAEEVEQVTEEPRRKRGRPRKHDINDNARDEDKETESSTGRKKKRSPLDEGSRTEQMDTEMEEEENPSITVVRAMDNDEYQLFLTVEEASAREFAAKEEQRARAGLAPAILPYKKNKREPPVGEPWTEEEDIMFTYLREVEGKGIKALSATLGRTYTDVYSHLHQVRPLYQRQKEFRKLRRKIRSIDVPRSAFGLFSEGQPLAEMRDRWKALPKSEVTAWDQRAVLDKERFVGELAKVGVTRDDYLRYRQLAVPAKLEHKSEVLEASDVRKKPRPKLPEESDEEYLANVILPREEKIRSYEAKMAAIPVWMNLPWRDKNPQDGKIPKLKPQQVSQDVGCDF